MISSDFLRQFIFCCLVLLLSGYAHAGEKESSRPCLSVEDKIECIETLYDRLQKDRNEENKKAYYDCFPSSFEGFHNIFGYEDKGYEMNFAPLAEQSHNYVFLFEEVSDVVSDNQYYGKLIDIAIGGYWQADGVSALQLIIRNVTKKDFLSFEEVLSQREKVEVESFWKFYFDGPHGVRLDESICAGESVNGKACTVLSELVRTTVPESHSHH